MPGSPDPLTDANTKKNNRAYFDQVYGRAHFFLALFGDRWVPERPSRREVFLGGRAARSTAGLGGGVGRDHVNLKLLWKHAETEAKRLRQTCEGKAVLLKKCQKGTLAEAAPKATMSV